MITIIITLLALCWGSFLNVVACRLIAGSSLISRSACPHCHKQIAWYDLIPIVSWIFLRGRCRSCTIPISWLYPMIELLTVIVLLGLAYSLHCIYQDIQPLSLNVFEEYNYYSYKFMCNIYVLFFSVLIITIRTDLEHLLIITTLTRFAAVLGLVASALGLIPITFFESLAGALLGAGILWATRAMFWKIKKQEGLGLGDIELMAAIGSFVGPLGVLVTLLLGSVVGIVVGLIALACTQSSRATLKIPFGALLALSAIGYVIAQLCV